MAKLIYFMPTSLDGYIADENYDWAAPDEEGFAFINDLVRPIGTYLYGRKMYETMAIWGTPDVIPGRTPAMLDFARIWQASGKIVYSKSLEALSTPNTRLEREFDPQAVRDLKAQLPHDVSVGGPTLAAMQEMYLYCQAHPRSPAAMRRPELSIRGDLWIAVLGPNVEKGIVGIGPSVAAALRAARAAVAARARIHRRDQLKSRRVRKRAGGARNGDRPLLERLTHHLDRASAKLGKFVEKEHAVMRQRDLARLRKCSAADECRLTDRVMGKAERA